MCNSFSWRRWQKHTRTQNKFRFENEMKKVFFEHNQLLEMRVGGIVSIVMSRTEMFQNNLFFVHWPRNGCDEKWARAAQEEDKQKSIKKAVESFLKNAFSMRIPRNRKLVKFIMFTNNFQQVLFKTLKLHKLREVFSELRAIILWNFFTWIIAINIFKD